MQFIPVTSLTGFHKGSAFVIGQVNDTFIIFCAGRYTMRRVTGQITFTDSVFEYGGYGRLLPVDRSRLAAPFQAGGFLGTVTTLCRGLGEFIQGSTDMPGTDIDYPHVAQLIGPPFHPGSHGLVAPCLVVPPFHVFFGQCLECHCTGAVLDQFQCFQIVLCFTGPVLCVGFLTEGLGSDYLTLSFNDCLVSFFAGFECEFCDCCHVSYS